MFRATVKTDSGVDRLASNAGLTRAVIQKGGHGKADIMESNESLLTRFDLSHYAANTTGTRNGYKFHALCYGIDERPYVEITKIGNQIIKTYTFSESKPSNIHDAEFRTPEPSSGKVVGAIVPIKSKQVDLPSLLVYLQRDDIAQETDILSVKMATPITYNVTINAYTNDDPRHDVKKEDIKFLCGAVIQSKYKNEARVSDHDFSYVVKGLGAYDVDILGLEQPLVCDWDQYAEIGELVINVMGKR